MSLLEGSFVAVTGGARGLGAAIAHRLAAEGATGVILDLPAALDGVPGGWKAIPLDVRDERSVKEAFDRIARLDVLVAAAGIVPDWTRIDAIDLEHWDEVFAVNVRGMAATLKHALPVLRDGASVVLIGSLTSWRGDPNIPSYVASKHAVLGLTRSAALAVGRRGIRVNALGPGPVATEALLARMTTRERELGIPVAAALESAASQTALGRMVTVEEVADAALFLASGLSSGITGQLLPIDAGML
jgi:NAD(P)-dependent dehydrogenase (short-subunit alcohol dehydrogenase family)